MKKEACKHFYLGILLVSLFVLWTIVVRFADVRPIGPRESLVGLSTLNAYVHQLVGVHMTLYILTDWLSLLPVAIALSFAGLGLTQWIKRKHLLKVDFSLLILGAFYLTVFAVYLLFEYVVVNHRPVLINGYLEASYPSSTTMLVLCIPPTAAMQLRSRIRNNACKQIVLGIIDLFTVFMVLGRALSGVHWFSDIVGGILISTGLVTLYKAFCLLEKKHTP